MNKHLRICLQAVIPVNMHGGTLITLSSFSIAKNVLLLRDILTRPFMVIVQIVERKLGDEFDK